MSDWRKTDEEAERNKSASWRAAGGDDGVTMSRWVMSRRRGTAAHLGREEWQVSVEGHKKIIRGETWGELLKSIFEKWDNLGGVWPWLMIAGKALGGSPSPVHREWPQGITLCLWIWACMVLKVSWRPVCFAVFYPRGKPWRATWGEDVKLREPSQLLPTFCKRREPEYLVTMEYSSTPKASAQDFTLKRRKKGKLVLIIQSQQNSLLLQTGRWSFPWFL